jgi:hypothetical protein
LKGCLGAQLGDNVEDVPDGYASIAINIDIERLLG